MSKDLRFVHLHNHTEYSLLDGASRIPEMVAAAASLEMPGIALTDHGTMYGAVSFYEECTKVGIKPIIGCELYVAPRRMQDKDPKLDRDYFHLTVVAETNEGYTNLIQLCTKAHLEGMYYKPRVDKDLLSKHAKGLIAFSGCLAGEVATKALKDVKQGFNAIDEYVSIFGKDNFYLELQDHGIREQAVVNNFLLQAAEEFGLKVIATNDIHYVSSDDADAHDVLLCLQTGSRLQDKNRFRFQTREFYLKTARQMYERFSYRPDALFNTLEVCDRCNVQIPLGSIKLPPFPVPEGHTPESYLRQKAIEGFSQRYPNGDEEACARLQYELSVIEQTGYATYFLIVWDLISFARSQNILVGPGRGSAAGSVVAYCLGITSIDPVKYGLIFERFLNPERISMPDIDIDFSVEGREKVIRYVASKYGTDRVAQIITFNTLGSKAVIRDVGRVLDVPLKECDRIAKMIPVYQGRSLPLSVALETSPELREEYENSPTVQKLVNVAKSLEGIARNHGTHAAGIVISPEPLSKMVPLQLGTDNQTVITQYDMASLGKIGLLKMDFLGLRNLDIIATALKLHCERTGNLVDLESINLDDPLVYELISRGDTHGVFQLEGKGMRKLLLDMRPSCFTDLAAAIALFRPGPMQLIPEYVARKQGKAEVTYDHEWLEPILRETYGVFVYQEQVMMAARRLAGFSMGEADVLRAAMGKKDQEKMVQQRQKFIDGAMRNGIDEQTANRLFEQIAKFAEYGFNKSHSVAYALISYYTAYLKTHMPVEFFTSLMMHHEGNLDKLADTIRDARAHGINVLAPDVNISEVNFSIRGGDIVFGLGAIKNVGEKAASCVVEARHEIGTFNSIQDLCDSLAEKGELNRRVVESLIRSGACDKLGDRSKMLANMDSIIRYAEGKKRKAASVQTSIFDMMSDTSLPLEYPEKSCEDLSSMDKLRDEKEYLGIYLSDHPLNAVRGVIARIATVSCADLGPDQIGQRVRVVGLPRSLRKVVTKNQNLMAYLELEDLTGSVEIIFFPKVYEQFRELVNSEDKILVIQGTIDSIQRAQNKAADNDDLKDTEGVTIIADTVSSLEDYTATKNAIVPCNEITVAIERNFPLERVELLVDIIRNNPGNVRVKFVVTVNGREVTIVPEASLTVEPRQQVIGWIQNALQGFGHIICE